MNLKFDDMKGDVKILSEGFARLQDEVKKTEGRLCIHTTGEQGLEDKERETREDDNGDGQES